MPAAAQTVSRSRRGALGAALVVVAVALGLVRFIGSGLLPATHALAGDFAAVFPSHYFARLRPDFPADTWSGWRYGPMVHFLTLPLLLLPRWSMVPPAWAIVNLAAIAASFVLVRRLTRTPLSREAVLLLAAAWLLYQPLVNCLAQGNIELIEMAMILAAIVALPRWRGYVSGVVIGVASMTKFLPIGFLFWFALRRHYRAFVAGVVTIAVIAVVAAATLGWKDAATFRELAGSPAAPLAGTQQLSVTTLFLHRSSLLLENHEGKAGRAVPTWLPSARAAVAARAGLIASLLLAAGFTAVIAARRRRPASADEIAVLFMTMFMILPWNHDYYYVFALVPLSILFHNAIAHRNRGLLAALVVAYVAISPPISFAFVDRSGLFRYRMVDLVDYFDLPIIGAIVLWIASTQQMFARDRGSAPATTERWFGARVATACVALIVVAIAIVTKPADSPIPLGSERVRLEPALYLSGAPALAISPDGARLAYVATRGDTRELCVAALPPGAATCVAGSDDAAGPFFSPDGTWVGFFAGRLLKKAPVAGGGVQVVSESRGAHTGVWDADGHILVASPSNGIMRVSENGGYMDVVVAHLPGESPYQWPLVLPDGIVLFTVPRPDGGLGDGWIDAFVPATGRRQRLFPGTHAFFDERTNRLWYTLHGRIISAEFDPATLQTHGAPSALSAAVVTREAGAIAAFGGGRVVDLAAGGLPVAARELVWVDRLGSAAPLKIPPAPFESPRLSPDGRSLVGVVRETVADLWRYDLGSDRPPPVRLTFTSASNESPIWSANGRIAVRATPASTLRSVILSIPGDGTEVDAARVWEGDGRVRLGGWSADGRVLVGTEEDDIWILDLQGVSGGSPREQWRVLLNQTAAHERGVVLSPDGRSIAFESDESGQSEVYVQPTFEFAARRRVSSGGGREPVWSRDGRELFYRNGDAMMAVAAPRQSASVPAPQLVFRGSYAFGDGVANYDVSSDGRRFLMIRDVSPDPKAGSELSMARLR